MDKFEDVDLNSTSHSKKIPILQNGSSTTSSSISDDSTNANNSHFKNHTHSERRETISFLNKITINFGEISEEKRMLQFQLFGDNTITTTKYNVLTWFPKSLLMQFMRIANVYFLMISILTVMPFSPKNPYTQLATFAIVLVFTMIKEAWEDYNRYRQDNLINNKITEVYNYVQKAFNTTFWSNLRPGDIVKIQKDSPIPADILLLRTSASNGLAFVDTKDLDGETNLKEKMVCPDFLNCEASDLINITGHIQCDLPNEYMDSWEGNLFSKNLKFFTNANIKNMLLKGSILKNTKEILGLVIYTGFNTKIMKNAKNPPIKMSNVMKTMNIILITVFFFQLICCNLFSFAYLEFTEANQKYLESYINSAHTVSLFAFAIKFFTFLVAYSHLIPISLYVAMEIVKILQSWFISYDNLMFDESANKPAIARTSELIEELGQVEFLFSDKTGTLTVNKMEFKNCYIGGVIFGASSDKENNLDAIAHNNSNNNDENFDKNGNKNNNGNSGFEKFNEKKNRLIKKKSITFENYYANFLSDIERQNNNLNSDIAFNFCGDGRIPKILAIPFEKNILNCDALNEENLVTTNNNLNNKKGENLNFIDETNDEILDYLGIESSINISAFDLKKNIINFFRVCTLCHSAICEEDKDGKSAYACSSPEELTFLNGSKNAGFSFTSRTPNSIEIFNHYKNEKETWEILLEVPFESDRRRMTIVVKRKDDLDNVVHVLIKGADEALLPLMNLDDLSRISLEDSLKYFACQGYRTLVMAYKTIEYKDFEAMHKKYKQAFVSENKKQILTEVYEELENNFSLGGVCAIEDQLQEGVPETIELLLKSNIKVWVLTGDKEETALNIGRTCRLIEEINKNEIRLTLPSNKKSINTPMKTYLENIMDNYLQEFGIADEKNFEEILSHNNSKTAKQNYYMIISGEALIYIFKNQTLSEKFFKLGLICRSVICCRVSAKQKSQVVKLVKSMGNWTTLAVGDGTNDVPMIMEANIGVGIQGVEGTQAVRSADYGICQFKHLQRLILVHGRNGYRRISNFICYYFYKNIILVFAEIYFVYYSGFSGQPFFPDFLPILYNSAWTSWPCIFAYSIESDIVEEKNSCWNFNNTNENDSGKYNSNSNNNNGNKPNPSKRKIAINNLLGSNYEIIPKLYRAGQIKYYFNLKIFWLWLLYAIIHGGLSYIFISSGIRSHSASGDGKLQDHWWTNTLIFSCIIHIVTFKIFIEITYWNWLVIGTSVLSVLVYYISILLISYPLFAKKVQNELTGKVFEMIFNKTFWLYVFTLPLLVLVFDFCVKYFYRFYKPNPVDLVNMGKIAFGAETDNIVRKMTQLKPNNEVFDRRSIMNHYLLNQHTQKKSVIELGTNIYKQNNVNNNNRGRNSLNKSNNNNNFGGNGTVYDGKIRNSNCLEAFQSNINDTFSENLIGPGLDAEFETTQKENKSRLINNERQ